MVKRPVVESMCIVLRTTGLAVQLGVILNINNFNKYHAFNESTQRCGLLVRCISFHVVGEEIVFITEIAFTYPKLSFNIRINRDKERG